MTFHGVEVGGDTQSQHDPGVSSTDMIQKRRILTNATSSVIQITVSGLSLLLLYRFLIEAIGVTQLGIWALVLAISSLVQVGNLGLTGSIVKNIADYDALGDKQSIVRAVQTAAIFIALLSLVVIGCAHLGAKYYFDFAMDGQAYQDAVDVLPLALVAFWIFMVTSIYQSGLYGCQRIVQRNGLLVIESISHLLLCIYLAPRYGLFGLAYARVIQNLVTLMASVALLKRYLPELPLFPCSWDQKLFKEMIGYAASFQVIAVLTMLADPVTKAFLGKFGSISMVGYFEMANKLVQQFRAFIMSANQVLVPIFARLNQLEPSRIRALYLASHHLTLYLSFVGFGLLAICAPLISIVWVGEYEPFFVWSTVVLCAGWLLNTLSGPAYFASMGTGDMSMNVASQSIIMALNAILSLILGWFFGGRGVVLSWGVALGLGSITLMILFCRTNRIVVGDLLPRPNRIVVSCCVAGIAVAYLIWVNLSGAAEVLLTKFHLSSIGQSIVVGGTIVVVYMGFMIVPLWSHPLPKDVQRWVQEALASGKP